VRTGPPVRFFYTRSDGRIVYSMSDPLLTVSNLGISFGDNEILRDISFTAHRGDLIALVGPNGSGKSVLLRSLLGLIPHAGTIAWAPNTHVGYVPQSVSVERSLPFTGTEFFAVKGIRPKRAAELAAAVGIERSALRQRIGLLSSGQLQRLLIAWALANEPQVILFDEPTSGVDVSGQESVYDLLDRLRKERGLTILLVSHDLNVVYARADHVLCISRDLICHGPPRKVLNEAMLERLYGTPVGLYSHHERHEH